MQFRRHIWSILQRNNPDLVKCYCFHIISVDIFINIPRADSGMLSRNGWQINESYSGPARTLSPSLPLKMAASMRRWVRIPHPPIQALIFFIIYLVNIQIPGNALCIQCYGQHYFIFFAVLFTDKYSITEIRLRYWELRHTKKSICNLFCFLWVFTAHWS